MSFEQPFNSIYGTDSNPELSESSKLEPPVIKSAHPLYSSAQPQLSGIESNTPDVTLSHSQHDSESHIEEDIKDISHMIDNHNQSSLLYVSNHEGVGYNKTESFKSLWSVGDVSDGHDHKHILPNEASPFVFDGHVIRYNVERGIEYDTPVVFGSRKIFGEEDKSGYRPSHFIFDPKSGTLLSGYNDSNTKNGLSKFSIITGLNNLAEPNTSACGIIGGVDNTIVNSHACAIIGSTNVTIEDCEETVALGIKLGFGDPNIKDYTESTFVRDLYALSRINAGPLYMQHRPYDAVLDVNGNAYISGNLAVTGHFDANSGTFNNVVAATGTFQSISVVNMNQNSAYVQAGLTGTTDFSVSRGDGVNIIYANSIHGNIRVQLGSGANSTFEANRALVIKDVSLEFGTGSAHNIYIWVPGNIRIEHYGLMSGTGSTGTYGILASMGGTYVLNSSGGSVTFRYVAPLVLGAVATWVIENQLIGNPRLLTYNSVKFPLANEGIRARLLHGRRC